MLALGVAAGWIGGLYLTSQLGWPGWLFAALAALGAALVAAAAWRARKWLAPALALVALGLGGMRYEPPAPRADDVARWLGAEGLGLRGAVLDEPRRTAASLRLRLTIDEAQPGGGWQAAGGRVEVTLPRSADARLGDRLEVWGRLEAPPSTERFDYAAFLARHGVFGVMRYPPRYRRVAAVQEEVSALGRAREHLARTVGRLLPQPQAGIAEGLLLGRRGGLTDEVRSAFGRSGTTHLLVVSGYNVALVSALALWLARRVLRQRAALAVAVLTVLGYAAIVGPDPPVIRATIMGLLALVALALGRTGDALNGLALAAIAMTAWDPQALFDLSFQLSCLATAGLVLLAPLLERPLARLPAMLRTALATTLAAQLAVAPVLALNFGRVQLVGLPANALALPAVPVATISAAAATLAALVFEPLGQVAAVVPWLATSWLLWVAERFGALPWAEVELLGADALWAWPYYALLLLVGARQAGLPGLGALLERGRAWLGARRRAALAGAAALALMLGGGAMLAMAPAEAAAHFLDVGEGDATLVVGPGGEHVLVDAGPPGPDSAASVGRRLPFFRRTLDLVVLTDTDTEHLGGLLELAERYELRLVIEPANARTSALYRRWRELAAERGITVRSAATGMSIAWPGLVVEVLDAGAAAAEGRVARALVARVRLAGQALLIPGDAPPEQQRTLAARGDLAASALRVPWRGAADALDAALLAVVRPQVAVVSAGRGNRWGHPVTAVLDLLAGAGVRTLRTDRHGTVTLTPADDGWRVATSRDPAPER
ncbi:MAG: ComEC/Rec2 family competence protein [Chloroflexi bacterium]|nr:ComEC/Rec2 family competence protein [Chloroflexota bacterium]